MKLFIGNTETLSDWQQMLQTSKDFADANKSDKIIGGNPYTRNELNVPQTTRDGKHFKIVGNTYAERYLEQICCIDNPVTSTQATIWADIGDKMVRQNHGTFWFFTCHWHFLFIRFLDITPFHIYISVTWHLFSLFIFWCVTFIMLQFVISFRGTQKEQIKDICTDLNITMVSLHDHENDSLRRFEHPISLTNQLTISIIVPISYLSLIPTYMI